MSPGIMKSPIVPPSLRGNLHNRTKSDSPPVALPIQHANPQDAPTGGPVNYNTNQFGAIPNPYTSPKNNKK